MRIDWKESIDFAEIEAEHIQKACEALSDTKNFRVYGSTKIFVLFNGEKLPAKWVVQSAYRLANNLPDTTEVVFASGEKMISFLKELGFEVGRF